MQHGRRDDDRGHSVADDLPASISKSSGFKHKAKQIQRNRQVARKVLVDTGD
ncbi:hypothetical protein DPMN_173152 [Dreissena polymorpha]|uniref:Uncharacterized protein n=1 Tax=Dreissena polymorpha TaxID=45954 RepID=A0A9D4E2W5_DREPO|nr:hypothetical protein DPMN_173152 [Dreissena polymorpha]